MEREPGENRVQTGVKRALASVVGLVLGLVVGLLLALFVVGFGDAFVLTVVLVGLAVAVLAYRPSIFDRRRKAHSLRLRSGGVVPCTPRPVVGNRQGGTLRSDSAAVG